MGNSILWWYPPGHHGGPHSIDLGRKFTNIEITPIRDASDANAIGGNTIRHDRGGMRRVRLALERCVAPATIRELRCLETHLQAGGILTACLDEAKTWASWTTSAPQSGDTTLIHYSNRFTAFYAGSLAVGDDVSVESPNPEYRVEYLRYASEVGWTMTSSIAVRGNFTVEPVFIRYADFFPCLRLGADQLDAQMLTHDRRMNWTFDAVFEERPADIKALYSEPDLMAASSTAWEARTTDMILRYAPVRNGEWITAPGPGVRR